MKLFRIKVCEDKEFLSMPVKAQALYLHLNARADKQGYYENYNKVMQDIGVEREYLDLLINAGYLIKGKKGVVIIRSGYIQERLKEK